MASNIPLAPDFIQFLFSAKTRFDCYFRVGNENQGEPERIGGVKLMLMAHSEVFRAELEESELKEKNDVPVKDIHPDTFRGMLKFVYGYDTTSEMCFAEADNLLYAAEKYMMKPLKDKLAVRLMKLLNPDNICSLLNNPACYTHLELNAAINEILRYETDCVLASSEFLSMNVSGFLKILEQDELIASEMELWRAAFRWAKNRANTEDGQELRQQLSCLTQHLRPFALTLDEICEVITTDVLTKDEVKAVCLYHGKKETPPDLSGFSRETEPRRKPPKKRVSGSELAFSKLEYEARSVNAEYKLRLVTKNDKIELLPLICKSTTWYEDTTPHRVECTTTVTKVSPGISADEPPITVTFREDVQRGVEFEVPLAVGSRNITLLPNSKYEVKVNLRGDHMRYYSDVSGTGDYGNDHLIIHIFDIAGSPKYLFQFPSHKLQYRVVETME